MGCSAVSAMPLSTHTHQPSSWSSVMCDSRYKKRWIKEPDIEPLTGTSAFCSVSTCNKEPITWVVTTTTWSVSTSIGSEETLYPYTLSYSMDGLAPFTVPVGTDTIVEVKACQDVYCEQIPNSLTIYTDQSPSMIDVHTDIQSAVTNTIKPRLKNYLLANNHPVANIDNIVTVLPITNKNYLADITATGIPPLTNGGNTNVSLVFIDIPTNYVTSCSNSTPTTTFLNDITAFRNMLLGLDTGEYKGTFFAVTSAFNVSNICPALGAQFNALYTGTDPNYPLGSNLSDKNNNIKFKQDVLYKNSTMPNTNANISYYADVIINALIEHGIDLTTYNANYDTTTICRSLTARVPASSLVRIYTANRFVPLFSVVKFENVSIGLNNITSITVDFDDGIILTYTGSNVYSDFYVVYNTTGYKTLNITYVAQNGSIKTQAFPRIVNVVSYYD